jgi:thymidylate synthase (FAD)
MKVLQNAGTYKILAIMGGLNGEDPISLIETAGRTAYQSRDKITNESALKFIKALRVRGHESVFEHSCMTVEFNDVSRGFTHELVRHRLAAYTQESTRYVDEKEFRIIAPPNKDLEEKLVELTLPGAENSGLKVSLKVSFNDWVAMNEQMYKGLRQAGWVPQDARQILPNGLKSQIVITANLREWRHIFKMRTAIDAHWEIREVMVRLLKEIKERVPVLFDDFEISSDGQSATLVRPQLN